MLTTTTQSVLIFVILCSVLLLLLVFFVTLILFRYQQKQNIYFKDIETLKASHENTLLQSQLEIQEQTFQNISREIHDSIGQKLTLAKLHLNTLSFIDKAADTEKVTDSVNMIGEAINDLTDISRSMSSEIILNNGLIKALEYEVDQLKKSGVYRISVDISGNPVFMEASTELLLFRIVQEAINNIIKHAQATVINLHLHYNSTLLAMEISDNGRGFSVESKKNGTGLINIKKRAAVLKGAVEIISTLGGGTQLKITIPLYESTPGV